jgi:hypothetical protein
MPAKKSSILNKPTIKFEYLWFEGYEVSPQDLFFDTKGIEWHLNLLKNQVIRYFSEWKPEIARAFDTYYGELKMAYDSRLKENWLVQER